MLLIHNMLLVLLIFRANIFMIRIIEQSKMFEVYLKYLSINHQLIERKKKNSKYLKIKNIIKRGKYISKQGKETQINLCIQIIINKNNTLIEFNSKSLYTFL